MALRDDGGAWQHVAVGGIIKDLANTERVSQIMAHVDGAAKILDIEDALKAGLKRRGLGDAPADVTSFFFEWEWDRAWRWLLQTGKSEEAESLKAEFVDFCIAQLAYDQKCCREFFGHDVTGIALGHFVAFLAETIDPLMARIRREGFEIVPLADALADPAYDRVGSVVTASFQVYQQKMAALAGKEVAAVAPSCEDLMKRVFVLAEPLRPVRRGLLVQNKRGPNP